ncbi:probable beta-D-xylosidase 7 [Glycine soja]|uniref:Putative beta-D-xylosidase 7 isoform A n=2 Tax=Glycine soja TaxID=3848 RepID=A0A445H7L9_GLYSO|nr:probable beta-D-xylosidase 7 [Glycine soja]RZB69442.1 putative beta-D-xylosidase 7 isoform A [Glycine soja]
MTLSHFSAAIFISFLLLTLHHHAESTQPPYSCDSSSNSPYYPFCNTRLPITKRAQDLVSRLTLDEKLAQLVNTAPAIPRLGIPSYQWWSEALHGVADAGFGIRFNGTIKSATSFPQVILTAASFDPNLWYQISKTIGKEARAVYNAGQATGMTFWAPNINVFRDPRWGRGQETAGEDPLMNAKYGVAYVRGLQGDSFEGGKLGERLQASACCKHFTAYDLDHWKGLDRFVYDARVTSQDLADTYQPPFQSCIEQGRASGIMCAYNRVNGVPNCANFNLLTKTARQQWKFDGYITSDCGAVSIIHDEQGYAKTAEDAIADVFRAGMDVECGDYITKHGKSAVSQKKLPISQIDRALQNLFSIRIRLGLLDGNPTKLPFGTIGPDQVCSKQSLQLALEAARDGIVLLKNTNSLLPLPKTNPTIALIGPNANASSKVFLGNYYGRPCNLVTLLQGFEGYAKDTVYHPGCDDGPQCAYAQIEGAVEVAKKVDYVVLVMGLDQSQERESHDREYLGLPGKQEELIKSVARASKRPVVLVLLCGGPVDITSAKFDDKVGGILWAGYPGELGGVALAQVVFGDHNPGGKLPITWYPKDFIKVPMTDMRMRADPASGYPGRTYRFYTGPKVYEFGYGLSYTKYSYKLLSLSHNTLHINQSSTHLTTQNSETIRYKLVSELAEETCQTMLLSIALGVTNRGNMAGKHPVLLFVRQGKVRNNGNPVKQLVGFQSVKLNAGETVQVGFELSPCEHLSVANEAGSMVIEEGSYLLLVGDQEYPIEITV